jgi:hypothetical protein
MAKGNHVDRAELKRLTDEHGYEAADLIAEHFGVTPEAIYRIWREKYGYYRQPEPKKVNRAVLEELTAELGYDHDRIADILSVHPDSIRRIWRQEYGVILGVRHFTLTDEQMAWLEACAYEGMPATWIAENFEGVTPEGVRLRRPADAPSVDWSESWQAIFTNPELLKLHYEFAPKSEKAAYVDRMLGRQIEERQRAEQGLAA